MKILLALPFAAALLLLACSQPRVPATPALWEVTGPEGQQGYLFGTIHTLSDEVDWRTARVKGALDRADRLVLEIRQLDDAAKMQAIFTRLATTPGQPPLASKVSEAHRGQLARLMKRANLDEAQFASMETWAAALTLAQAAQGKPEGEGVGRKLRDMARGKPVEELDGTERQLSLFDALPEKEQRDLLDAVVAEAADAGKDENRLEAHWRRGDINAIARETGRGMLADPELRDALLIRRNRAWADRVEAMLKARQRPFVAVGAGHMAGPQGLPALLSRRGYAVRRIQ